MLIVQHFVFQMRRDIRGSLANPRQHFAEDTDPIVVGEHALAEQALHQWIGRMGDIEAQPVRRLSLEEFSWSPLMPGAARLGARC